jgi:hypothetical protein
MRRLRAPLSFQAPRRLGHGELTMATIIALPPL